MKSSRELYVQRERTSFDNFEFENLTFGLCLFYYLLIRLQCYMLCIFICECLF